MTLYLTHIANVVYTSMRCVCDRLIFFIIHFNGHPINLPHFSQIQYVTKSGCLNVFAWI